jgi:hypothetical protein
MVALMQEFIDPNKKTKMRGNDRLFVIKQIDEKAPLSSTGLVDKRLFTGENRLHAIRDEASNWLWYFKYDTGAVPEFLKGRRYTKFNDAQKDAEKYFNGRNVKIEEVVD